MALCVSGGCKQEFGEFSKFEQNDGLEMSIIGEDVTNNITMMTLRY